MSKTAYQACACGSEYPYYEEGSVPDAIDECMLCSDSICPDCRITVKNSKGEDKYICEECRDACYGSMIRMAAIQRQDAIRRFVVGAA